MRERGAVCEMLPMGEDGIRSDVLAQTRADGAARDTVSQFSVRGYGNHREAIRNILNGQEKNIILLWKMILTVSSSCLVSR